MVLISNRQAQALQGFLGEVAVPAKLTKVDGTETVSSVTNDVLRSGEVLDIPEPSVAVASSLETHAATGNEVEYESEEEGVKRWLIDAPHKERKVTEKKRADAAAFVAWLETNQKQISGHDDKPVGDQEKSLSWLVKDFESQKIIANPRDYQIELFEKAKLQNTIAVLDTGSGKTLIAALLLRWTIEKELEDRAAGKERRIAFFLVDKVALVFQQYAVIDCNLDYPAARYCGEMVENMWDQASWSEIFAKNEVIICTAEILYKCLHHSYIRMDQINLLIFDEAHHTKKNHPYARLIKDFYMEIEGKERVPKILGMTASPVDAQVDVHRAAAELEGLLHSQIVTAGNPADLQSNIYRPKRELIVEYARLLAPFKSQLHKTLEGMLGRKKIFNKALEYSMLAASELGPWCSDRFWKMYFGVNDLPRFEAMTEQDHLKRGADDIEIAQSIKDVREAFQTVQDYPLGAVTLSECHRGLLSSKLSKLVHILEDKFAKPDSNKRAIVFVQQRWTAMMLTDLFQQRGMLLPGLRVDNLVGAGSTGDQIGYKAGSFRDQVVKLIKFKKGDLNCLFATSIAEEGLDIPDCNLVIRFDLYNTMIQYIQSRGRARHADSEYIHMIEAGNPEQQRRVLSNKSNEGILRRFCEALPADRKLTGNDFDVDYFLRKEKGQRQYTVPGTGAKLNYKSALTCLADFTASLPHPSEVVFSPFYSTVSVPNGFQCEVTMPETSPVHGALGRVHLTKQIAKCSAAFEMCLKLIEGKYLNDHLKPIFTKQLPAMRNAHLSISSKKRAEYVMRTKPKMWPQTGIPERLYVTVLALLKPEALGFKSQPMLLLTRQPIPALAKFPLFFSRDRSSDVRIVPVPTPISINEVNLGLLANFTLKVFLDVFSKDYDATPDQLPYFFAPTTCGHGFDGLESGITENLVDWETLEHVKKEHTKPTGEEPDDYYTAKFLTDPWDGSRKLIVAGRRPDLKPTDRVPEGVNVSGQHRAWNKLEPDEKNILNFSVSLWSNARNRYVWKQNQPVFEAQVLWTRRNLLDDNLGDEDVQARTCFVILEPFNISALSAPVVSMAMNLPSILFKIESTLIALDACNALGLPGIEPSMALESFTKDSDNTEEHDVEQINFQGGMGNNYERLEFLGDTFLKMATTISIFTLLPDSDEFEYHVERMLLICNKNLFNNALEVKLQEYIRSKALNRRTWYPEGLTLKRGMKTDPKSVHVLGDKSIADVCEALIGAAYLTAQKEGNFDLAVKAVTIMVNDPKHSVTTWADYYTQFEPPEWQTSHPSPAQKDMARRMAARIGYTFTYPRLLRCAFMHPSYPSRSYEKLPSYQRLEFLGDALLDMCCVSYLYKRYPGADPQWLTEHKMAMVSNKFLGCLSIALGFHKNVVSFSSALQGEITSYVTDVTFAIEKAQDEAEAAGLDRSAYARNYWVDCLTPPKCLSDVVESYIGAIFVDAHYDFAVVQHFFDTHVLPFFADMTQYDSFAGNHPVTRISKLIQDRFHCQDWRLLVHEMAAASAVNEQDAGSEMGNAEAYDLVVGARKVVAAVRVHGQTVAHGIASSGRVAKTNAAKSGLEILMGLDVGGFREKFGCACRGKEGEVVK